MANLIAQSEKLQGYYQDTTGNRDITRTHRQQGTPQATGILPGLTGNRDITQALPICQNIPLISEPSPFVATNNFNVDMSTYSRWYLESKKTF